MVISGRLLRDGQPLQGAVIASRPRPNGTNEIFWVQARTDGRYDLRLSEGSYRLKAAYGAFESPSLPLTVS